MLYAQVITVSKKMMDDLDLLNKNIYILKNEIAKSPANNFRKLLNFTVAFYGEDGMNIVDNRVTIKLECESYKAPRIVKRNIQVNKFTHAN